MADAIHPGEHLAEILGELGISQYRLAKAIGVPPRRINEIVGAPDAGDAFHWMEDPPDAMLVTGLPMQFDVGGAAPPAPAPRLGEHTQQALQEWLGMSAEETEPFVDEGTLT